MSDGTAAGTLRLFDSSFSVGEVVAGGNRVLFQVSMGSTQLGVYVSDGTPAGTRLVGSDLVLSGSIQPTSIEERIFFSARRQDG